MIEEDIEGSVGFWTLVETSNRIEVKARSRSVTGRNDEGSLPGKCRLTALKRGANTANLTLHVSPGQGLHLERVECDWRILARILTDW